MYCVFKIRAIVVMAGISPFAKCGKPISIEKTAQVLQKTNPPKLKRRRAVKPNCSHVANYALRSFWVTDAFP